MTELNIDFETASQTETSRPKLLISISGGRTSAVMSRRLWNSCRETHDILMLFANTGCEHLATLDFLRNLETVFGLPIVWLEATVDPRPGKGVGWRVVNYASASRDGRPFEDLVRKYGIYNKTNPSCTARLKTDVMHRYAASKGFTRGRKLNYTTAIGIRADEIDRMSARAQENRFWYPLIEWGITKRDIAKEIKTWPFDLEIPSDAYGNCVWCWKKSMRKHMTLALEAPEVFDFPARMEREYGHVNGHTKAGHNGRKYWFREHRTAADIIAMAHETVFEPYSDDPYHHAYDFSPDLDVGNGSCGESCEAFADD